MKSKKGIYSIIALTVLMIKTQASGMEIIRALCCCCLKQQHVHPAPEIDIENSAPKQPKIHRPTLPIIQIPHATVLQEGSLTPHNSPLEDPTSSHLAHNRKLKDMVRLIHRNERINQGLYLASSIVEKELEAEEKQREILRELYTFDPREDLFCELPHHELMRECKSLGDEEDSTTQNLSPDSDDEELSPIQELAQNTNPPVSLSDIPFIIPLRHTNSQKTVQELIKDNNRLERELLKDGQSARATKESLKKSFKRLHKKLDQTKKENSFLEACLNSLERERIVTLNPKDYQSCSEKVNT